MVGYITALEEIRNQNVTNLHAMNLLSSWGKNFIDVLGKAQRCNADRTRGTS